MRHLCLLLFCTICSLAQGQALRDINFNYLYDPSSDVGFDLRLVRLQDSWKVLYKLQLRDTSLRTTAFNIQWETREGLNEKSGVAFDPEVTVTRSSKTATHGNFSMPPATTGIIVAKVVNTRTKRAWMFYQALLADHPTTNFIMNDFGPVTESYITKRDTFAVGHGGDLIVSYYNDNFPTASPPFAETQARVNRGMKQDSTFNIRSGSPVTFSAKGLYLIQRDTNASDGLAIRAEDDYPKLARIQSLAGPLVYVCSKQEYDRVTLAKNDKKAFDRIILSITTDTDRAKKFMRNYFRRVDLSNQFFSSYKEGWKTDRGMIFIVFGLPDAVYKFSDREVWNYSNDDYKVSFNFTKAPSLFDPENYVLIREKKYQQTWYEVIDLWRNARF